MRWHRLGKIWESHGQRPWMASHAAMPTPERIGPHQYRIYFSPRDAAGRSQIGWLTIDIRAPTQVLEVSETPCLAHGTVGAFDDSGAMVSCLVHHGGQRWLYFTGWNLGVSTPWRTSIGLACGRLGEDPPVFARVSTAPVLDRSSSDPLFVGHPFVVGSSAGGWRMWYFSGTGWHGTSPARPRYNIRMAESADGLAWRPNERVVLDHVHPGEVVIARPQVLARPDIHQMFYCYRGDDFGYRPGYAESTDGLEWVRRDSEIVFDGPAQDWDREGTAYPAVFDHEGLRYMLYCGNQYSRAGFGIAVLQP